MWKESVYIFLSIYISSLVYSRSYFTNKMKHYLVINPPKLWKKVGYIVLVLVYPPLWISFVTASIIYSSFMQIMAISFAAEIIGILFASAIMGVIVSFCLKI